MWVVVNLFSDNSRLDDVYISSLFIERDGAVANLVVLLSEFIADFDDDLTKKDRRDIEKNLKLIRQGGNNAIIYGNNSWEIRELHIN